MTDERRPGDEPEESPALEDWGAGTVAPPELRARTLEAARARGLVKGRTMQRTTIWMAAAAVLAFVAGFGLGGRNAATPGKETTMTTTRVEETPAPAPAATGPRFAIFLFEDARYATPTDDSMPERVREYGQWARDLAAAGRSVDGEKLADGGTSAHLAGGTLATDGPGRDAARGVLAGYFVIGAADLDDAMAVARTCPHLKYGGSIEVRPIES